MLVTIISYDDINRVYQKNYQADSRIITHTYDQERSGYFNKGALTTLSSPEAVYEFNYDNMGREVKETRTIDSTTYQTERQYDMAGRLEHIIYPDTARTQYNYQYNGMGFLKEVRKQGATYPYINIEDTDYTALGQIKNTHYGNGVNTAYEYYEDGSYRLKDIATTRNGTPIQYIHYEFDEAGNIEAMDVTTHTNAVYTVNHDFTYDALNRLITATATCSNDTSRSYNQGYTYDLAGNMTNKTGIGGWDVLTWESDVNKPRIRPKSVRFDAEVAGIANRNIINNQDQKPIQITYQGSTTNLYYDGAGERIKKVKGTETVIYVGGIFEVRNGQSMSYVYANGQKIVTLANNKEYYTHSDHLGSTGIVTDETGTVVEEIGYLPFGSTLFRNTYNGSTWASSYRFTGQELDPEYHLYNYGARLYDPIMSRFITPDTIVPEPYNPQSLNRYSYCLNNPLIYTDPSGHTSITPEEWAEILRQLDEMQQYIYGLYPSIYNPSIGFMMDPVPAHVDLWNLGFEELDAWLIVKPFFYGGGSGGGYTITSSNYDPHNTDPKYREDAIIAAMRNFGVNVNRKDISYEPGAVAYGGVYHNTGKIYIGPSAFEKSFDFLGDIIGHERVHYYQYKQVLIPPVNTMWDAATEVLAEDWVLRNIEKGRFSLNVDEKQIFEKGRDKNFKKLNEGYIKMYNEGFFNPKMPNWE